MLDKLANTTTPSVGLNLSFRCGDCGRAFESRRSVSNHHSKTHGKVGQQPDRGNNAGRFVCEFCGDHFPTNRSLGQHIRNRHMAEASSQRTAEQRSVQRLWSTEEHQRFVDTIRDLGPVSNVDIAPAQNLRRQLASAKEFTYVTIQKRGSPATKCAALTLVNSRGRRINPSTPVGRNIQVYTLE